MKPIPFGKYSLLHRVDTGGMAEVFRAKAFGVEGFERIVAVKRILPNIAADLDFITMFIDEAKLAVQLTHANIAQIFDLGRVGESYFIALEYVHGKDLRAVFDHAVERREQLPVELVAYVMMKICEGLDYAHEKRDPAGRPLELVHRDVSPQNMLVSFEGDVKLIDFGIAKAANKASRTRAGILKGKFGYLSPEQVRGESVDRRSDVFGVGTVLHELLTGERLFIGDSEFSTIEKVRSGEIPSPRILNRHVPKELARIVMRALARERENRYQTALELHDALQNFLHTRGVPFHRKELSAWMLSHFPDDAARDLEQVGDLEGAETLAFNSTDVAPSVPPTESSAVYKETRDAPEEAQPKHPSTILGMPAVLPPADLATPSPGRASMPPPPPRGGMSSGPGRPPGAAIGRSAPPPPPRTVPPAAAEPQRSDSRRAESRREASSPVLPAPISAAHVPAHGNSGQGLGSTLAGTGSSGNGPMLSMDWDDEELSTQIYDRPVDDYESVEAGYDDLSAPQADDTDQGFGQTYDGGQAYGSAQGGGYADAFGASGPGDANPFGAPAGVHVSPRAYAEPSAAQRVEPISSLRAPSASQTMTMHTDRPAERRNPLYAALAVAAVVLLCFVGYVFLSRTEPGTVQLTTHPAEAVVTFDGKQVGSISPFVITGVSPNEKHLIEVKKDGYRPWSQEVQVQAGQPLQFPVTLQPEGSAEPATAVGASGTTQTGGFSIETSPAGAAVLLDGQELSGVTPLRVANLLPRAYELRIKLAGFREHTTRVDVRSGVDRSLPRVALEAERVRLRIASEPVGSEAVLVRGRDRRALGRTPIDVTLDNDGAGWTVEVTKSGYEPFSQPVAPEAGAAELSVRAVLTRKERSDEEPTLAASEPPRATAPAATPSPSPTPRAAAASSASARPAASPSSSAAADEAPAASGAPGTLRINSRPWAQVFVDGRNIGNTPQMNVSLPAGAHRVMLVNPEFNLRKTLSVNIRPGQVETQIVTLQ
jgi:serine/threonine protein kinase